MNSYFFFLFYFRTYLQDLCSYIRILEIDPRIYIYSFRFKKTQEFDSNRTKWIFDDYFGLVKIHTNGCREKEDSSTVYIYKTDNTYLRHIANESILQQAHIRIQLYTQIVWQKDLPSISTIWKMELRPGYYILLYGII